MRNRWITAGLLLALGLLTGPVAGRASAQPWDLYGNNIPTSPLPTGPYQHDGSGFYTGFEFMMFRQYRNIGSQQVAIRGFRDSSGLVDATLPVPTGAVGRFFGSGEEALNTSSFGGSSWSPGTRMTVGYRLENGWNFSISWLHLFDTKYSAAASTQGPNFANPGPNLENTFLFSPVFNFSPEFTGPVARVFSGGTFPQNGGAGVVIFGALNGIWNGASDMTLLYSQRFDNWDITGKFPVFESENARTYAMAGGRFSWIWERFEWRTRALGINVDQVIQNAPPQQTQSPDWNARYSNALSQRMYGPFLGFGHDVYMGSSFSMSLECTGALLLDIAKQRAKYVRGDQATQAKRSWIDYHIVPNANIGLNMSWQPIEGITIKLGYNMLNYFNTLYMEQPIGFNVGNIDPSYKTRAWRVLHGSNVGVGFVW